MRFGLKKISEVGVAIAVFATQRVAEYDLNRHIEFDIFRFRFYANKVAFDAGAVVEINDGTDIGNFDAGERSVHNRVRV